MKLRLPAGERRHAHLRITHIDDGRVQTMLLEDPGIARDEQHTAAFIQAAVGEDRFVRRRGGKE